MKTKIYVKRYEKIINNIDILGLNETINSFSHRITTYHCKQELTILLKFLLKRNIKTVVEIGVAKGAFAYLTKNILKPYIYIDIDKNPNQYFEINKNYKKETIIGRNSHSNKCELELHERLKGKKLTFYLLMVITFIMESNKIFSHTRNICRIMV